MNKRQKKIKLKDMLPKYILDDVLQTAKEDGRTRRDGNVGPFDYRTREAYR